MKSIWLTYYTRSGAHKILASTIEDHLKKHHPSIPVKTVDLARMTPFTIQAVSGLLGKGFNVLPHIWTKSYYNLQNPRGLNHRVFKKLMTLVMDSYTFHTNLLAELKAFPPGVILSFTDTANFIFSYLKKKQTLLVPLFSLLPPDTSVHNLWLYPEIDRYFVGPYENLKQMLAGFGVDGHKLQFSGIPVRSSFVEKRNARRQESRQKIGLNPDRFTIAITGGYHGFYGLVEFYTLIESIAAALPAIQIVVIQGTEAIDRQKAEALENKYGPGRIRIAGFVTDPAGLLATADLIVTKAGGLTIAETSVLGKPLLIIKTISGQEWLNARYLSDYGSALVIQNDADLIPVLRDLMANPARRDAMAKKARELGKKNLTATEDIVDRLISAFER